MSIRQNITVEATLGAVDRVHKQIADLFFQKPNYLDGNPRKDELIQMLTAHLEAKKARCKSIVGDAARACAVQFAIMLEELDEADEKQQVVQARKIAQAVFEESEQYLQLLPNDLLDQVFMVAIQYFNS